MLFTPKTGVGLNAVVFSDVITFTQPTHVAYVGGTAALLYRNDIAVGNAADFQPNDRFRVQLLSAGSYARAAYAVITVNGVYHTVACITKTDPTSYPYPGYLTHTPYDIQEDQGSETVDWELSHKLDVYPAGSQHVLTNTAGRGWTEGPITNTLPVPAYRANKVLFVGQDHKVKHGLTVPQPFAVITVDGTLWVTAQDGIRIYQGDVLLRTIPVLRPQGMAISADQNHIYVACKNGLWHFYRQGQDWLELSTPLFVSPYEVAIDAQNTAWFTTQEDTRIYKLTSGGATDSFVIGRGLRGLTFDSLGNLWAALATDNQLAKIDVQTQTYVLYTTSATPYYVKCLGNVLYVGCLPYTVETWDTNTGLRLTQSVKDNTLYGFDVSGSEIWARCFYPNTPSFTYVPQQYPIGVSLQDSTGVPCQAVLSTNTIQLQGLQLPVWASIPNIYHATLLVNDVVTSRTVQVKNGDQLRIRYIVPDVANIPINIPIFVGAAYSEFNSVSYGIDITPDPFTLQSVHTAQPGESLTSNSFTITGIDADYHATLTVDSGSIIVNGLDVGQTAYVYLNDLIQITTQAPISKGQVKYVTVSAGTYSNIWTIVTQQTVPTGLEQDAYQLVPECPVSPLVAYIPSANDHLTTIAADTYEVTQYPLTTTPVVPQSVPYIFLTSFYGDKLWRADLTGQLDQSITVLPGSLPYGLTYTPRVGSFTTQQSTRKFVTLTGRNSIAEITQQTDNYYLQNEVAVGTQPYGIDSTSRGTLYVANYADGTVSVLTSDPQTYNYSSVVQTIGVGTRPLDLKVDNLDQVWVSLSGENKVAKIKNNVVELKIQVGTAPWGLAFSATHLWVCNSYDNTVSKIDLTTELVVDTIQVGSIPSHIAIGQDNKVWISHLGEPRVLVLDHDSSLVLNDITLLGSPLYGIHVDPNSNNAWVLQLHSNSPVRTFIPTPLPAQNFGNLIDLGLSQDIVSDAITVSGLPRPAQAYLTPYVGSAIILNGIDIGTETALHNGDVVQIRARSSVAYFTPVVVELLIKGTSTWTFSLTTEHKCYPDFIRYPALFNGILHDPLTSDTAIVAGIAEGQTSHVYTTFPDDLLIINGQVTQANVSQPASLVNGDVLQLISIVVGKYDGALTAHTISAVVPSGDVVFASIDIGTKVLEGAIKRERWQHLWDIEFAYTTRVHSTIISAELGLQPTEGRTRSLHTSALPTPVAQVKQTQVLGEISLGALPYTKTKYLGKGLEPLAYSSDQHLASTVGYEITKKKILVGDLFISLGTKVVRTQVLADPREALKITKNVVKVDAVQYVKDLAYHRVIGIQQVHNAHPQARTSHWVLADKNQYDKNVAYQDKSSALTASVKTEAAWVLTPIAQYQEFQYSDRSVAADYERNKPRFKIAPIPQYTRNEQAHHEILDLYQYHAPEQQLSPIAVYQQQVKWINLSPEAVYQYQVKELRLSEVAQYQYRTKEPRLSSSANYVLNNLRAHKSASAEYQKLDNGRSKTISALYTSRSVSVRHSERQAPNLALYEQGATKAGKQAGALYTPLRVTHWRTAALSAIKIPASRYVPLVVKQAISKVRTIKLSPLENKFIKFNTSVFDYTRNDSLAERHSYGSSAAASQAAINLTTATQEYPWQLSDHTWLWRIQMRTDAPCGVVKRYVVSGYVQGG